MGLKDSIIDAVNNRLTKEQNPWQPYQGPGGGEGWMNAVTGEVRYQDNRPEPSEGMPEEHEGGLPEGYDEEAAEQYEEAETVDDWLEPDLEDWADEIDGVSEIEYEREGEIHTANPIEVEEDLGTIEVIDDETFEEYHIEPEQIETHPLQLEPELGWGEGWEDPPVDPSDLETGQEVELYDFEKDEWVTGEVRQIDDWGEDGMYVDIFDEENDEVYEFLGGEASPATEAVITAQEDLFRPDLLEDFDPMGDDFEPGDDVVLMDEPTGEFYEGEVSYVDGYGMQVETEGGSEFKAKPDNRFTPLSDEGMAEYELEDRDMLEAPALTPDSPDGLAEFDGEFAEVEHPTEGSVVGEVDVIDHDEKGRHLYVGDTEVGIPLDDPEHPLAQVEVDSVENPYNDFDPDYIPYLEGGDELVLSNGDDYWTTTVDGFSSDGSEIKIDGGWMDTDELAEGYDGTEVAMTDSDLEPSPPEDLEWEQPESAEEVFVGDEVWFDTVDTELPTTAEVSEVIPGVGGETDRVEAVDPESGEEYEVHLENLEGHAAASGGIPEAETKPGYLSPGDGVEIAFRDRDGEITEVNGMMISEPGYNGDFTIRGEDGEIHRFNNSDNEETFAITDDDVEVGSSDGSDRSPDEIADEVVDTIDLGNTGEMLDQDEKSRLKGELMYHYSPDRVREFYDLQSGGSSAWKTTSGSQEAADYEKAYKEALGIEAPGRGEELDGLDDGYASRELKEIAETAAELSQRHFEETYGDGYQLDRGTSPAAAHNLFSAYLAAPAADEYDSPFLAINNFSTSRHTAERFEGHKSDLGATVAWEASTDDVVAMHDYLFTEEGSHDTEGEITLRGDMDGIPADQVELNSSGTGSGANFGKLPEEWSGTEAGAFVEFADKEGDSLSEALDWSEDEIHNALEIRDVLEDVHGIDTSGNNFFNEAETAAEEVGVSGYEDPTEDIEFDDGFEEFDPYEWEESELAGETIRYEDSWGEEHEGEVLDVDPGGYIETEIGHEISSLDITEVQSGEKTTADDFDVPEFDAESLESGDEVMWVGYDGIESGPVSYTGDSGEMVYVEDDGAAGGVATVDASKIIDVPGEVAEGSEGITADDLSEGDEVMVDGEYGTVEQIHEDFGADGEDLYAVVDENGVVIDEYYPDEIPDNIDPVDEGSDDLPDIEDIDEGTTVSFESYTGAKVTGEVVDHYEGNEEYGDPPELKVSDGDATYSVTPEQLNDTKYTNESEGTDTSGWNTDLGNYVNESQVTGATPGDKITVEDEFVGDEIELEVIGEEDGIPTVDPVDHNDWGDIPIDQHDDWTIQSVQEGEASGNGMADFDPGSDADKLETGTEVTVEIGNDQYTGPITDIDDEGNIDIDADSVNGDVPAMVDEVVGYEDSGESPEPTDDEGDYPSQDEFESIEPDTADDLDGYEGEWVRLDLGNFEDPVVGRLDEAMDAGPNGMVEVSDVVSTGDSEFPMNSYTGGLDEVGAVHADEDDGTGDFNDEIDGLLDDVGLNEDESNEGSDAFHFPPDSVHNAMVSEGEQFRTDIPGDGEREVEAVSISADPNAPIEVSATDDDESWLIWPNGDVESA